MANLILRRTASIRILLFRWGLIEPGGLSVLWALLSSIIVADKSKEEMYMVFVTKVMKKLCNTGTHSITIGSISSKAWPPGSFAINLRPQARSSQAAKSLHASSFRITQHPRAVCKESTFWDLEENLAIIRWISYWSHLVSTSGMGINFVKLSEESQMSEVLGSFSADCAALCIANRNCIPMSLV